MEKIKKCIKLHSYWLMRMGDTLNEQTIKV